MEIEIRYTGTLPLEGLRPGGRLRLQEGTTVGGLLDRLGVPAPLKPFMIPIVNGERRDLAYVFAPGDELDFFSPAGGG